MRFGLQINPYFPGPTANPWDAVLRAAHALDASAFDSLWLYDHFLYEGGYSGHPLPEPVLECFTTLGAIAAVTEHIRLGQLVIGAPYRNPALLTKMATTLDLLSHGRSILGIGAGWHRREHEAYGWGPFEEAPTRLRRLEEALRVITTLWTDHPASFDGALYHLEAVQDRPAPLQRPHPPILVGGSGERVTLRLVAEYAQMCNVSGDAAAVGRLFDILRHHCERSNRSFDEITRSIYTTIIIGRDERELAVKRERLAMFVPARGALIGTPEQITDQLAAYARVGCQYVIFRTPDWLDLEPILLFSECVIPALAGM